MKPIDYVEKSVNRLPQENLDAKNKPIVKQKKKMWKILVILSVSIIAFLWIFFIIYYLGYIPIGLSVIEPIGNAKTVDVANLIDEFPSMGDMPNLDKIEYEAFDTDASVEEIVNTYHNRLIDEGYSQEYSGTVVLDGVTFEVNGYVKGLTAVGILTTDEITENYDSLVLYATGNALDFKEILDWYKNN